ncbi:hypothetical protein D3C87_965660 [compost metagenome]
MPAQAIAPRRQKPRKPQLLRDRHTVKQELNIEKKIQDTEVFALAHELESQRQNVEGYRLRAIKAIQAGDPAAALRLLAEQEEPLKRQGKTIVELVEAESRDVGLNNAEGEIIRLEMKEWESELP